MIPDLEKYAYLYNRNLQNGVYELQLEQKNYYNHYSYNENRFKRNYV